MDKPGTTATTFTVEFNRDWFPQAKQTKMERAELFQLASYALMKGYDYETMGYCDAMYGIGEYLDDVWEIVEEAKEKGLAWFREEAAKNNYQIYGV